MSPRRFVPCLGLALVLLGSPALAEPPAAPTAHLALGAERVHVGAAAHWTPERLGRRLAFGLGWSLPQGWYDVDGQLLTERSLLTPGDDVERSGLYLAYRF